MAKMQWIRQALSKALSMGAVSALLLGASILQSPAAEPAKSGKESGKVATVTLVVGGTNECPYCLQVKKRLAADPALKELVKHYRIAFVDISTQQAKSAFLKRFQVDKVSEPTLVFQHPDGSNIRVVHGSPQGDALQDFMEDALLTASGVTLPPAVAAKNVGQSIVKRPHALIEELLKNGTQAAGKKDGKPGVADAKKDKKEKKQQSGSGSADTANRVAAARDARKLLREQKVAEAVVAVADFVGQEPDNDPLAKLIESLTRDGKKAIDAASVKLKNEETRPIAAVALVKAKRQYGKLSSLDGDFDVAFTTLGKSPDGDKLKQQAEAVDKGRTLDEAGDKEAALKVYRQVIADFAGTPVAKLAATRVKQLTQ
ncbi:MAG: thioredoxin family protein [Planctomycetes bacterium]|nr:thioredoxin family protein [Planctomycetota bacterium]